VKQAREGMRRERKRDLGLKRGISNTFRPSKPSKQMSRKQAKVIFPPPFLGGMSEAKAVYLVMKASELKK